MRRIAKRFDEIERLWGNIDCNLRQNPSIFPATKRYQVQTLDGEEMGDGSDFQAEVRRIFGHHRRSHAGLRRISANEIDFGRA